MHCLRNYKKRIQSKTETYSISDLYIYSTSSTKDICSIMISRVHVHVHTDN